MSTLQTKKNTASVSAFIATLEGKQKKKDSKELVKIFESTTGLKATMWGESMIGFGSYHYTSEKSSQEGEWPLTAFAPRGKNISIYLMPGVSKFEKQLAKLGKHKVSKGSCLYINKLSDVDTTVLAKIILSSVKGIKQMYPNKK